MTQGCDPLPRTAHAATAPRVSYGEIPDRLPDDEGLLAAFGFGDAAPAFDDPRYLRVTLEPLPGAAPCLETWHVDGPVEHGADDGLRWSHGGGWLYAALEVDEAGHGSPQAAAEHAYTQLCRFLRRQEACHVQRLWNYLGGINRGNGDEERYKHFCAGRVRGMDGFFEAGFPAATAIGHDGPAGLLQVYCLASVLPGTRVENPRQLSAWRYPRQYGPTPPSFARAMRLPAGDALAISGTAAIIGHQSQHLGNLAAQLDETLANLRALLRSAGLAPSFGATDPLKVYVRHAGDAVAVERFLDLHAPQAPRLLLAGDICRSELLVEVDGWRYA